MVERGAGDNAQFSDKEYEAAGATLADLKAAYGQDIILKVRPPDVEKEAPLI